VALLRWIQDVKDVHDIPDTPLNEFEQGIEHLIDAAGGETVA
jgi:hypothetical protein